jgi:hypothetical protein
MQITVGRIERELGLNNIREAYHSLRALVGKVLRNPP